MAKRVRPQLQYNTEMEKNIVWLVTHGGKCWFTHYWRGTAENSGFSPSKMNTWFIFFNIYAFLSEWKNFPKKIFRNKVHFSSY